jgi:hypothetical protein
MSVTIKETDESPWTWALKPFVPEEDKPRVSSADILLVPCEGYHERSDLRYFPTGTPEFLRFLERESPLSIAVEACGDDDDFREISRHADIWYVAAAVVKLAAVPLFVRLLGDYLAKRRHTTKDDVVVKSSLTVHDGSLGRSMHLDFEGPVSDFRSTALDLYQRMQMESHDVVLPEGSSNHAQDRSSSESPERLSE